jgi:hypothetical protein
MATLLHFELYYYYPGGFYPGQTHTHRYRRDWFRQAVVATAQPFAASNSDRTLTTELSLRTTPDQLVEVTIRNVGRDPMFIYYVTLEVMGR